MVQATIIYSCCLVPVVTKIIKLAFRQVEIFNVFFKAAVFIGGLVVMKIPVSFRCTPSFF